MLDGSHISVQTLAYTSPKRQRVLEAGQMASGQLAGWVEPGTAVSAMNDVYAQWDYMPAALVPSKYPGRSRIDVGLSDDEGDVRAPVPLPPQCQATVAPQPPPTTTVSTTIDKDAGSGLWLTDEQRIRQHHLHLLMTLADIDLVSCDTDEALSQVREGALADNYLTFAAECKAIQSTEASASPYGPNTWLAVLQIMNEQYEPATRALVDVQAVRSALAHCLRADEIVETLDTLLPTQREQLEAQSSVLRALLSRG